MRTTMRSVLPRNLWRVYGSATERGRPLRGPGSEAAKKRNGDLNPEATPWPVHPPEEAAPAGAGAETLCAECLGAAARTSPNVGSRSALAAQDSRRDSARA